MKRKFLIGTVIFFIAVPFLLSQSLHQLSFHQGQPPLSPFGKWKYIILPDSLASDSTITVVKDSSKTSLTKKEKTFKMHKSPLVATLLSAVVPGAGQFYNQSYWKIPVIAAFVGYFGYEYFHNNNIFKDYRDRYSASQVQDPPNGDLNLKTLREFYHNQRDDFVWYFMIVYVINLADAYVDAHLFDFDVSEEKISTLGIIDRKATLKFHLNF